jgi:putative aldouronate transport system substrate-binding protein
VVSPDTPTMSQNSGAQAFYASKFALYPTSYFAFTIAWNRMLGIDKDFRMSAINPFGHDGGKGYVFQSWGGNQVAVLRKADSDRVKLLLGVLNYLAAPFGTQEDLNRTYGVEGTHFTYDDKGNPVRTDRGRQEVEYMAWGTIISPPAVLYNSADSKAVAAGHPLMVAAHDQAITDPTIGLFSNTYANKAAVLTQGVVDGVNEIIFGRAPVSSFDDLVKKWKADGGDTIRGEFEAELAKA